MAHTLESSGLLSTPMWGSGFDTSLPAVLAQTDVRPPVSGVAEPFVDDPMYREKDHMGSNIEDAVDAPALDATKIKWLVLFGLGAAAALLL
ncbi:MAG: hypothetical protein ACPGR8_06290 [Limisphaerales bacterium]